MSSRLIMDAGLSNNLKQGILVEAGLKAVTSKDCRRLAAKISAATNRHISVTTIKRVFGFAETKHHFSKYTIAALQEYVKGDEEWKDKKFFKWLQDSYIVAKSPYKMDILSFITDDRSCIDELNESEPYLHPEHLVITALKMMLNDNLSEVAICKNGKYIGRIYAKELQRFVYAGDQLVYHRLNFDLVTAITVMQREG